MTLRAALAAVLAITLVGMAVSGEAGGSAATGAAPVASAPATVVTSASAAVRYAGRHGMRLNVAVVDTHTGALYTAGGGSWLYPTASVVKVLIAARLLVAGRMHGHVATLAWTMITRSDNDAAYRLYALAGRRGLLPWLERHYRVPGVGTPETQPGRWGSTMVRAAGLARLYAALRRDPRVWPWLSRAMRAYAPTSTGGEPNAFGLAGAAPHCALKNGWATGRDVRDLSAAVIHTTGFVDHGRFAVVVLGEAAGRMYYAPGERVITSAARLLLPHGTVVPVPEPAVRALSVPSAPSGGGTRLTVGGTGFTRVRSVLFGTVPGHGIAVLSPTRLRVTVPAHAAGVVAVRVVTAYGTSQAGTAARLRYLAPPVPTPTSTQTSSRVPTPRTARRP